MHKRTARVVSSELLCKRWGTLTEYQIEYTRVDGTPAEMSREVYDRGHAAAVLLHDPERDAVTLVRQFRPPPLINGFETPYLIEACAGVIDKGSAEECARREALEETGLSIRELRRIGCGYGNPAALTEIVHLFIGTYDLGRRLHSGGGLDEEGEDIEVLELSFDEAWSMVVDGRIIDMKTIILLQRLQIDRLASRG